MEFLKSGSWIGGKRTIRHQLRKLGIGVREFPSAPFHPVSVLQLVVRLLMGKHGPSTFYKSLSLEVAPPLIIQFETGHLSNADCDSAVEHLTRHGYEIYWAGLSGRCPSDKGRSLSLIMRAAAPRGRFAHFDPSSLAAA